MLLRKDVYPYEYMDDWEKFNETSFHEKEEFCSNLSMEDIRDADYMHAKRVCKDFEIKHLGEYHNLYLKSDTLLLADVKLDPVKFSSAPGLAWQVGLKKDLSEIRIIN